MKKKSEIAKPTVREFVALIRSKLDEMGSDVAVDRLWADTDTEGYSFLLQVPVGSDLRLPLLPMGDLWDTASGWTFTRQAEHFAKALVTIHRAEKSLISYARKVEAAARLEIQSARSEGLDLQLEGMGFQPTRSYHMATDDWKDGAAAVLAEVRVRNTSFFLRPEITQVWVDEPEHVAREFADLRKDQRERQERLRKLDALGADLVVDSLTIDLLNAHGLDPVSVLRDVWKTQCVNLKVEHHGKETNLALISADGNASASVSFDTAYWNGEHLWFVGEESAAAGNLREGQTVNGLLDHPAFSGRKISRIHTRGEGRTELVSFDLEDKVFFDADSGRIWNEVRKAA